MQGLVGRIDGKDTLKYRIARCFEEYDLSFRLKKVFPY
jgi:hypothetical protein